MLTLREIWRYPVKSMGGEQLDRAEVGSLGIDGDRQWGVRDQVTGLVLTARREPRLLMATSVLVDGDPVITTDTGELLATSQALSEWLDRPVQLIAAGDGPATFENPLDIDAEDDWVTWQSQPGTFHDGRSTVSLVSSGSLGDHERRRFRINLVFDGDGEDDLVGNDIMIGTTRLRLRKPIGRCIMVARAQPGIPADLSVLKRVIRDRDNLMGVGAVVVSGGAVALGDVVVAAP